MDGPPVDSTDEMLEDLNKNTTVLTAPEDQHIKDVSLMSGWVLNQITFVTNKGVQLGPVPAQSSGGNKRNLASKLRRRGIDGWEKQYYLCGISGYTYQDTHGPFIANLDFHFSVIRPESMKQSVVEKVHEHTVRMRSCRMRHGTDSSDSD